MTLYNMMTMAGFDFGTTTSSAVFARANVVKNGITGSMEYGTPEIFYAAEPKYTPFLGNRIDELALASYLDAWIREANIGPHGASAGGAIVTGLAAQKENSKSITTLIRARIGDAMVATANDPSLESWLAFMGSARGLSRELSDRPVINIDIGGGTTNIALGINGEVRSTGCIFIGARHVQVVPGTYQIQALSQFAHKLFAYLGVIKGVGETLTEQEIDAITDFYLIMLRRTLGGRSLEFNACEAFHEQVRFTMPSDLLHSASDHAITVSGGVGELIYRALAGESNVTVTPFGDLGWNLALKLIKDEWLLASFKKYIPKNMGRATAFGLALHSTEVSGTTVFLPPEPILPLTDLPVVARIANHTTAIDLIKALELAAKSHHGAAIQIEGHMKGLSEVQSFAAAIANALHRSNYPTNKPLVLLIKGNVGKTLGSLITSWGCDPFRLVVIDEVSLRDANFVNVGKITQQIIPISFYGM